MSVCRAIAVCGALLALLASVIVAQLDEGSKYEFLSRLTYPLFRFGWSTGHLHFLIFKNIDDTNFKLPAAGDAKSKNEFLSWRVGSGDVVVSTFSKSGTHLAVRTVIQVMSDASEATGDSMESIHHSASAPEIITDRSIKKCRDDNILTLRNAKALAPLGEASLFGTHLDYHHVPHHEDAKYLVMARDPVDILLSMHTQLDKMLGRIAPRKGEVVNMLRLSSGGWAEFNLEWWKHRNESNVLFYFFEDAVKDPPAFVRAIMGFLGKPKDPEVLGRVLERSSFAYMKKRHETVDPPKCMNIPPPITRPLTSLKSVMANKGEVNRGHKEIDDETKKQVREYCQQVMAGSDFPVERLKGCV